MHLGESAEERTRGVVHSVQEAVDSVSSCCIQPEHPRGQARRQRPTSPLQIVDVPRQSPDLVSKNPGEQVSHKPPEAELLIHPAAQAHVLSEVQVPCRQLQPTISSELQATHL